MTTAPLKSVRRAAIRSRIGVGLSAFNQLQVSARLYGGTDKVVHGYMPYYETHLGPRRLRKQLVFEIGVGGYKDRLPSGSLRVWRDYLGRSTIVGLDIEEKEVRLGPRVKFEKCDQSKASDLLNVVAKYGRPHVVIDDGSHIGVHINTSFDTLWPQLHSGGIYVIEDLSTSYYPDFGGGDPVPADSGVGLVQSLVDSVQARDNTFQRRPWWGTRSAPRHSEVSAVFVYPGIAFVIKAT